MPIQCEPQVGDWYKNDEQMSFEVIAVDDDEGIVEIQYFDGAIEELDAETWYELDLEPRQPPEDWSGPFDGIATAELDDAEAAFRPHMWTGPLDAVE